MPVASSSGTQAAGSALWAQIQQQQAQRTADQAEQRARALQIQAQAAQSEAGRAQETARALQVESKAAQSDATEARRSVVALRSQNALQEQFSNVRGQIARVLDTTLSATPNASAGIVNTSGQQTGTVIDVTA